MVKRRVLDPLPVLDHAELVRFLANKGFKSVHAKKVAAHAIVLGIADPTKTTFEDPVPGTPRDLVDVLRRRFAVLTSTVEEELRSADGTIKLVVRLQDGMRVEAVIIRHLGGPQSRPRNTLCVSSQVGCNMGCRFCATGTMGLLGDLSAGEILEQVIHAQRRVPIRNVVFMGMGEPCNNLDSVLKAIEGMVDARRFGIAPSRITLSTVGVVPRIRQLTREAPQTQLALSLHAPNQALRNEIVPSASAYKLPDLMAAVEGHLKALGPDRLRRVLIEYVMIDQVNDRPVHARELAALLGGMKTCTVNLIPYNATGAAPPKLGQLPFAEPTAAALEEFRAIVVAAGLLCTIRMHHGRDIDGACGQLVIRKAREEMKLSADAAGAGSNGGGCCRGGEGNGSGGGIGAGAGRAADIEDLIPGGSNISRSKNGIRRASSKGRSGSSGGGEDRSGGSGGGAASSGGSPGGSDKISGGDPIDAVADISLALETKAAEECGALAAPSVAESGALPSPAHATTASAMAPVSRGDGRARRAAWAAVAAGALASTVMIAIGLRERRAARLFLGR